MGDQKNIWIMSVPRLAQCIDRNLYIYIYSLYSVMNKENKNATKYELIFPLYSLFGLDPLGPYLEPTPW